MKYIFIRESERINTNKKICFRKTKLNDDVKIDELLIERKYFDKICKLSSLKAKGINKIICRLRVKWFNYYFSRVLKKEDYLLKNDDADDNCIKYVLSNRICFDNNKLNYIETILNKLELCKFSFHSEYEENIDKYIESYMSKNKMLPKDIKVLVFINTNNSIDLSNIQSIIKKYKVVNFCTEMTKNKRLQNTLNDVNYSDGTTSDYVNVTNKTLKEYNVYVFIGKGKNNFQKYRFKSNALYVDTTFKEADVYNSCFARIQDLIKKEILEKDIINSFFEIYGKLTVSNIICNIQKDVKM